jgi:hypothetical protein
VDRHLKKFTNHVHCQGADLNFLKLICDAISIVLLETMGLDDFESFIGTFLDRKEKLIVYDFKYNFFKSLTYS